MKSMSHADINEYLHRELPLTSAMGATVTHWDGKSLTITAPLAPNLNHTDTAFGGSISTLGILTGYTILYLALKEREVPSRIIIQKSTTDFLRPIDTALTATASLPAADTLEEFLDTLRKKRRSRITLDSQLVTNHSKAATHTGIYVAIIY